MAYLQLYLEKFSKNIKQNMFLLAIGFAGFIGIEVVAIIFLGYINNAYLNDKILHWVTSCYPNPFLIAISIALFNCMRNFDFSNKVINYLSGMSLLIYIIHDNLILRLYFRPAMWNFVYQKYGYSQLLLWVFALTAAVFLFSLICSVLYDKTIRWVIHSISNHLYFIFRKWYLKAEKFALKFY